MLNDNRFTRAKYACFATSLSTAATGNLTPLLFLTFREMYGLSYTLLGLLVLINFGTQLLLDLVFSFYSHKFNLATTVKLTPVVITAGMVLFATLPLLFPSAAYVGIVIGTVVFSAGSGLAEVLISPTVAAIPSDNPERLMSRLHSCYAWGVVAVVPLATLYLFFFDTVTWFVLPLAFSLLSLFAALLFAGAPMPPLTTAEKTSAAAGMFSDKNLVLCVICIFLGGAAECTMAQWASGYLEQAVGIEKIWGDLIGVAGFGLMLALGRTLYGRYGKNISRFLLFGALGATACYAVAAFSNQPIVGLVACGLTGFCVAMLWPGSLILLEERIPHCGVAAYAMMAAGGDLGASAIPQLVGIITDSVIASPAAADLAASLSLTTEQLGMKAGMAVATAAPLLCALVVVLLIRTPKKAGTAENA